jgi:hypothetical protein
VSNKPWPQFELRTVFLRVPHGDYLAVRRGRKTEFRATSRATSSVQRLNPPTPVVAYSVSNRRTDHRATLMVLEATWREELRAISDESLAREGFSSFAEFRRYWKIRHNAPFRPLDKVWAFRVRPWQPDDPEVLGRVLVERLYGQHIPKG